MMMRLNWHRSHIVKEHVPTTHGDEFHALARLTGLTDNPANQHISTASLFATKAEYEKLEDHINCHIRRYWKQWNLSSYAAGKEAKSIINDLPIRGLSFSFDDSGHVQYQYASQTKLVIQIPAIGNGAPEVITAHPVPEKSAAATTRGLSKQLTTTNEFKALRHTDPARVLVALSKVIPDCPIMDYDPQRHGSVTAPYKNGRLIIDEDHIAWYDASNRRNPANRPGCDIWDDPKTAKLVETIAYMQSLVTGKPPTDYAAERKENAQTAQIKDESDDAATKRSNVNPTF